MPEISRFFGIVIAMFDNDHPPPHFHVRYESQRGIVDIATLSVLEGSLSPRTLGMVVEWAAQTRTSCGATGFWHVGTPRSIGSPRWSSAMLKDIVEVKVTGARRLRLRFEDGIEGEVDVAAIVPFEGIFAPLRDPKLFATVEVDQELGTIRWPNGADLDPDVLYAMISGQPTPDLSRKPTRAPAA